jgi:hypothetical protein
MRTPLAAIIGGVCLITLSRFTDRLTYRFLIAPIPFVHRIGPTPQGKPRELVRQVCLTRVVLLSLWLLWWLCYEKMDSEFSYNCACEMCVKLEGMSIHTPRYLYSLWVLCFGLRSAVSSP